ncbi:hypothetical protein [Alteribacillus bidgolensis]|uniref:Uncharacterized protein n=1 Tax=Alteribacillus bidgolensis TaxID=930129 RepID=A0A1G8D7S7_9BACI|nr:hypothetical protein [Alteribacillus bidgolensis]SDH53796.1 hypothetical protein SAMN05216352_101585 [Alteribacillus bidgolensis]
MYTKMKQLSSQEWAILILFIISIISLVLTVQLTSYEEDKDVYVNTLDEEKEDVLTYTWVDE